MDNAERIQHEDKYRLLNAAANDKTIHELERIVMAPLLAQAREHGAKLTARLRDIADLEDVEVRALRRMASEGWDTQADWQAMNRRAGI